MRRSEWRRESCISASEPVILHFRLHFDDVDAVVAASIRRAVVVDAEELCRHAVVVVDVEVTVDRRGFQVESAVRRRSANRRKTTEPVLRNHPHRLDELKKPDFYHQKVALLHLLHLVLPFRRDD